MLFDDILNECNENVVEYLKSNNKIDKSGLIVICNQLYKLLIIKDSNIKYETVQSIVNRIFKVKYTLNKEFVDAKCIRDCENMFTKVKVPKEYKKLEKHFNKLRALPQAEQRTKEWFDYRQNRITASDTASAIDENPYEPVEGFILKKCDPEHKFLDNQNVYHGKKYEPTATSIYEYIYNNKVIEFGALPSEKYDLLGASPDGICSCNSLDYKFSPMLGRMLEIKCTVLRKIYTTGKIAGHICPFYYYCQVQQQLECCDLDKCDFWQCKIIDYKNRTEYLLDECLKSQHSEGIYKEKSKISESIDIVIDNRLKKGVILKFLPKQWVAEFDGDSIEWKSKFIYPSNLLMDENENDIWVASTLSDWQITHADIAETHYYEKVVYWKLALSHNIIIERDIDFFQSILPILNSTWSRVLYYRENIDKLNELRNIIKKRSTYIKFDTKININNNLVDKKNLFLNYPVVNKLKISSFVEEPEFLD